MHRNSAESRTLDPTGQRTMASQSPFLLLPTELRIKILLQLDNGSLTLCRSVCRDLTGLISSEVALQYKLELARAGMIDGPLGSSQTSLSERLEKVKAYRTAWHSPTVVFDKRFPQRPPRLRIRPVTGGVLPYSTGLTGVDFWKPGSSLRGVSEVRVPCSQALQNMEFSSVSVDIGQDLVVLTTETLYPGSLNVNTYEVRLLTTACVPHPLAAQSQIRSEAQRPPPPYNPKNISSTEIFGDLVAWSASTDPGRILVWNWKTGDVLLRLTPYADVSCFKFLDNSLFLVLFDKDLRIYELHHPASAEGHPITIADCPCVLRLPAFAPGAVFLLGKKLHMQSSSSPSSTTPLFCHDPDLKIVCVTLRLRYIGDQDLADSEVENFMFLIPVATLLSHFHRVRSAAQADASAPREIPWDNWGPAGSRVFATAFLHVGVSGTKVIAVHQVGWDADGRHPRYRIFVLDINPFAVYSLDRSPKPLEFPANSGEFITTCRAFQGPVRSELPCVVTLLVDITLKLEAGADPRHNSGWYDLVVFEDQWALLYLEHYQDPVRFTSTGVYTFQI
ncbi:hypothetical protein LXA43DRAFT_88970 [Ganoderma leucocontextum]|nr:hypothetical protein LXA43DRAFT_88970 [Ganoderma leucocontextum]